MPEIIMERVLKWQIMPRIMMLAVTVLTYQAVHWFMTLPDPTVAQSGLISVLVGAGAAWFGLYVNSTSTQHEVVARD